MAWWYEGKRDENERWKIFYIVCPYCGHKSSELLDACPNCKATVEGQPYMRQGVGCVIDGTLFDGMKREKEE